MVLSGFWLQRLWAKTGSLHRARYFTSTMHHRTAPKTHLNNSLLSWKSLFSLQWNSSHKANLVILSTLYKDSAFVNLVPVKDTWSLVHLKKFYVPYSIICVHKNYGGHYLGGKSATGLMEWTDVESALEVYVIANHYTMHSLCKWLCRDSSLSKFYLNIFYSWSSIYIQACLLL